MKHFIWIILLGSGCVSLDSRLAQDDISQKIELRTGIKLAGGERVQQALDQLLASEVDADSAVRIALLANPKAQALSAKVMLAQAEFVRVGLLENPVLSVMARLPSGGKGGMNFEVSVAQNLAPLLTLGARKNIAAAEFEAEKLRIAQEVITLAAEVRGAFYKAQGALQLLELQQTALLAARASLEISQRLRAAGNITELALASDQAQYGQAKLNVAEAELQVAIERERLMGWLGLEAIINHKISW